MRVVVAWDGSGHALATLNRVADHIRPSSIEHIDIAIPVWPERDVPRWDDIHSRQATVDDLHGAAAQIAAEDTSRLLGALRPLAVSVDSRMINGDVVDGLVQMVAESRADILLIAAGTRDRGGQFGADLERLIRDSPVPTFVLRSPNDTHASTT